MKTFVRCASGLIVLGILIAITSAAQQMRSAQQDWRGIERFHQLDIQTTISGKADELAKLAPKELAIMQKSG